MGWSVLNNGKNSLFSLFFFAAKIYNSVGFEKHNPKLQYNKSYKDNCKRNTNQAMHAYSGIIWLYTLFLCL